MTRNWTDKQLKVLRALSLPTSKEASSRAVKRDSWRLAESQSAIAHAVGVNPSTISDWLRNPAFRDAWNRMQRKTVLDMESRFFRKLMVALDNPHSPNYDKVLKVYMQHVRPVLVEEQAHGDYDEIQPWAAADTNKLLSNEEKALAIMQAAGLDTSTKELFNKMLRLLQLVPGEDTETLPQVGMYDLERVEATEDEDEPDEGQGGTVTEVEPGVIEAQVRRLEAPKERRFIP
jgi:uncharacterized protein (DUF1778 family)